MSSKTDVYCTKCNIPLTKVKRRIQCDICNHWYHQKCTPISIKEYNNHYKVNPQWTCLECLSEIFPFQSIDSQLLINTCSYNSNTACFCSSRISHSRLKNLPCYAVMTSTTNIPHLSDIDVDLQLPCEINFDYYTPHHFHASDGIKNSFDKKSFSALHLNIRSLSSNFDPLCTLLSDLHHTFSIIGLSETKIKCGSDHIVNIDIPGYNFISQPTLSNAGGVWFLCKILFEL